VRINIPLGPHVPTQILCDRRQSTLKPALGVGVKWLIPTPASDHEKTALLGIIHMSLAPAAAMGLAEVYFPCVSVFSVCKS
jgi:hypothetical protein